MGSRRRPSYRRGTRLLEPGIHKGLVDATRAGAPVALAAMSVGISERAFHEWMVRGAAEEERLSTPVPDGAPAPTADPNEVVFHRLYREVLLARSQAGVKAVLNLQRAAQGGFITEEKIETTPDGGTIKTVKRAQPDWRASAWLLERQQRQFFGKDATQVEIVGGQDPALAVSGSGDLPEDAAVALAQRLAANVAAITAAPAALGSADDGDVVDAEVLPDGQ